MMTTTVSVTTSSRNEEHNLGGTTQPEHGGGADNTTTIRSSDTTVSADATEGADAAAAAAVTIPPETNVLDTETAEEGENEPVIIMPDEDEMCVNNNPESSNSCSQSEEEEDDDGIRMIRTTVPQPPWEEKLGRIHTKCKPKQQQERIQSSGEISRDSTVATSNAARHHPKKKKSTATTGSSIPHCRLSSGGRGDDDDDDDSCCSSGAVGQQQQQQQQQQYVDVASHTTNNTTEEEEQSTSLLMTSESSEQEGNNTNNFTHRQHHGLRLLENSTATSSVSAAGEESQERHHHHSHNNLIIDPSAALNFVVEHRIFLKAALDLLTERDRRAPELGFKDPIILKAGPLKKASHLMNGVWKVKYVEIRRGMFSYYENNAVVSRQQDKNSTGEVELLLRKNLPLEASTCTCRAVKLHKKALNFSPGGAIFELASSSSTNNSSSGNNPGSGVGSSNTNAAAATTNSSSNATTSSNTNSNKRLWMASSREERQAWIQAINNAMVGGSVTRGDSMVDHRGLVRTVSGRSPFKNQLRKYLKLQGSMRNAKTEQEYLLAMREILNHSLQVPVKWIAKQGMLANDNSTGHNNSMAPGAFQEETVALSVDQLWRDLQRDAVQINGEILRGDSSHGPERILGSLTRRILSVGRGSDGTRSDLRESKALVYARDLLLAGNRTRSAGDSYYCVNTLCGNTDLVVVVPSGTEVEPVSIELSEDESDESFHTRFHDKCGWIKTRTKLQRSWRRHFFVLSEGTLSYYEGATPRPHGLKGQRVLSDATISLARKPVKHEGNSDDIDELILTITMKDASVKDRLLLFESEDSALEWVYALECVTTAKASDPARRIVSRRRSSSTCGSLNTANSMAEVLSAAQTATMEHAQNIGLDLDEISKRLENYSKLTTSAVRVSVKASTEYKVCTTDPQGIEEQDTWATLQANFLQSFRITGGPNGRIMRGEEVVHLKVIDCLEPATQGTSNADTALSPTTMRARLNRRIFRNASSGGDELVEGPVSD